MQQANRLAKQPRQPEDPQLPKNRTSFKRTLGARWLLQAQDPAVMPEAAIQEAKICVFVMMLSVTILTDCICA